jgi:hypothetical protein
MDWSAYTPTPAKPLHSITLHQPFASLIACGAKTIETRGWYTPYRGPLAIHAGKRWDEDVAGDCVVAHQILKDMGFHPPTERHEEVGKYKFRDTLGCVVALAVLADCRQMDGAEGLDAVFGSFGVGRYGWVLTDVVPVLPPVKCRGAQGLWDVRAMLPEWCEGEV